MYLMDDLKKWKAIYRLLDCVSTEPFDCGTLCGKACCLQNEKEEMGIYLFPGEHRFLMQFADASDWLEWETQDPSELGFPSSWKEPVYFIKCSAKGQCERNRRPLQCRMFPLKPVIGDNGVLELIWNDEELPYRCPIIEKQMPVHDDFYKATYTVWKHLLMDERFFDLVMMWS